MTGWAGGAGEGVLGRCRSQVGTTMMEGEMRGIYKSPCMSVANICIFNTRMSINSRGIGTGKAG